MSTDRAISNNIRSEIHAVAKEFSSEFADRLPENNYYAFSLYTTILPVILGEISNFVLPTFASAGPTWNYLDGACSAISGVNQLLDETTHRPVATKIKGAVNVGNGATVITLTAMNFSLFGAPAFAAAFGTGFVLSLDETARAFARKYSFEYWMKDSLAQLEKLNAVKIKLEKDIRLLGGAEAEAIKASSWARNRKRERLEKLEQDKKELERDILFRTAANHFEKVETAVEQTPVVTHHADRHAVIEKQLNACSEGFQQTDFVNDLRQINNCPADKSVFLKRQDLMPALAKASIPETRKKAEREITKKSDKHVAASVKDSLMWGVAFAAVLLACIPGCQLAGLVVLGVASTMYLAKNFSKVCNVMKKGFNYFFGSKKLAANEAKISEKENLLSHQFYSTPAVA
jgi:hypothetical protein